MKQQRFQAKPDEACRGHNAAHLAAGAAAMLGWGLLGFAWVRQWRAGDRPESFDVGEI